MGSDRDALSAGHTPHEEPADALLARQLLSGNEDALRQLVDRHDRLVRYTIYQAGRRYCDRDPHWLDARANETWSGVVDALRRRGPNRLPERMAGFVSRIARNKCLDAVRRAGSRQTLTFGQAGQEPGMEAASTVEADPVDLLADVEQLAALRSCISRLTNDEKRVCAEIGLILERRWAEAADRLDMPESTLRSRWGVILGKLRACLEKKI